MKRLHVLITFSLVILFVVQSCKRRTSVSDTPDDISTIPIEDLTAPEGFNFESHKDIYVRVKVANPLTPTTRYLIKIYSNVPGTDELVKVGRTNASDFEFASSIRVPAGQEFLWIEKVNPDGSSEFHEVPANTFVSNVFDSKPEHTFTFTKTSSGMNCNSSCSQTYNNYSGNINVNGNKTICITGTFSGSITLGSNSSVKICGNATVTSLTLNHKKSRAYILEGAEVRIGNLNINNKDAEVRNWSDSLVFTSSVALNGEFKNYGKTYVNSSLTVNSNGEISNYGLIDVGGNLTASGDVYNYHFMNVDGNTTINGSGYLDTYCSVIIGGNLTVNDDIDMSELISVGGNLTVNGSGNIYFYDGALVTCENLTLNNDLIGNGSITNVIKVNDRTVINGSGVVRGRLDLCDNDGVETNTGSINSPAQLSCSATLPSTTCRPEGFNNVVVQDADNDGIPDEQDDYPNDDEKAFDSYYPTASTYSNIAFEDLWPNKGDFDFNDMVIAYNMQKVLNADEDVVEAIFKVSVRCVGGSYENGFGFRLDDIAPGVISDVTGYNLSKNIVTLSANNTEAGQDKAVIICFDSPEPIINRTTGSFFNTITTNPKGTSDTLSIKVTFSTPQSESKFAASKLNPFIFTNGRRGYEIHLADFAPTSLADNTLFGTAQDASNASAGRYYKTSNNLPWAILLEETFDYPEEKTAINTAYKYFNDWAISGGSQKPTWFKDLAEHRVIGNIFE